MPLVEIESPESVTGQPVDSYMTQIKVDGREIGDVRAIHAHWVLDDVVSVDVEVLASERLNVIANADVHVSVVAPEGFLVVCEWEQPSGFVTYRAIPTPDVKMGMWRRFRVWLWRTGMLRGEYPR